MHVAKKSLLLATDLKADVAENDAQKDIDKCVEKEACEDVVSEGATGVRDENDEEGDFEDEHDSEEKNDPEIAKGTDVPASTPTSHK
ncbi:hypothetical protein U1Q18_037929, partial [Sarracenia purpurea var. burkii]